MKQILSILLLVFVVVGCKKGDPSHLYTIKYTLDCDKCDVSFSPKEQGVVRNDRNQEGPFTYSYSTGRANDYLSLSALSKGTDKITAMIFIDGKLFKMATDSGAGASVDLKGYAPEIKDYTKVLTPLR